MPFQRDDREEALPARTARFDTTQWSLIVEASRCDAPEAREALAALCSKYWYPLYAYVRRRGSSIEDAKDLTQEFFLRLLEKDYFSRADPGRGRFRSFLVSSPEHFLNNEWDRRHAQRRGGGARAAPLDYDGAEMRYNLEPVDMLTPEVLFERRWAAALISSALNRLQVELAASGRERLFTALKGFLTADESHGYARVAEDLRMTEGAVKVAIHRMRRRFRALLRAEVAEIVSDEEDIDDEIRYLLSRIGAV